MNDSESKMIKVRFDLSEIEGAPGGETMWATPISREQARRENIPFNGHQQAKLENIPFFAYGYAIGDIVDLTPGAEADDFPDVVGVAQPSGQQTLRVLFDQSLDEATTTQHIKDLATRLEESGSIMERGFGALAAISVVAGMPQASVIAILEELDSDGVLAWEDGMSFEPEE